MLLTKIAKIMLVAAYHEAISKQLGLVVIVMKIMILLLMVDSTHDSSQVNGNDIDSNHKWRKGEKLQSALF